MGCPGVLLPKKTVHTRLYKPTVNGRVMWGICEDHGGARCQSTRQQDDLHRRNLPQGTPYGLQARGKREGVDG